MFKLSLWRRSAEKNGKIPSRTTAVAAVNEHSVGQESKRKPYEMN